MSKLYKGTEKRRCKYCNALFLPNREDQMCCSAKHGAIYASLNRDMLSSRKKKKR